MYVCTPTWIGQEPPSKSDPSLQDSAKFIRAYLRTFTLDSIIAQGAPQELLDSQLFYDSFSILSAKPQASSFAKQHAEEIRLGFGECFGGLGFRDPGEPV